MFGLTKTTTLALVGWLWADLLLGLFVTFLAANSAGVPLIPRDQSIDPKPIEITVAVNGGFLLGADRSRVAAEQARIASAVQAKMKASAPGRDVALVLAFGTHQDPSEGDRLAQLATTPLRDGAFGKAVVKTYHDLTPGDTGSTLALEVYVYH